MGEANTYMQVTFKTEAEAEAAEPRVRAVVDLLNFIYDSWQSERSGSKRLSCLTREDAREALRIMGLLATVEENPGNGLAFTISMPGDGYTEFTRNGRVIEFGGMTSHHVNWDYNKRLMAAKIPSADITWRMHDLCCDYDYED